LARHPLTLALLAWRRCHRAWRAHRSIRPTAASGQRDRPPCTNTTSSWRDLATFDEVQRGEPIGMRHYGTI